MDLVLIFLPPVNRFTLVAHDSIKRKIALRAFGLGLCFGIFN